ncbi:unnamed protein product [Polarella glacialis]|uniref:RING-type domain-containing protein n=1 Tax=Polarella glacialis TaxID=89957 RepID=A0A813HYA6_POLGL|nr:unnamed protein product [Polarella glacialis]
MPAGQEPNDHVHCPGDLIDFSVVRLRSHNYFARIRTARRGSFGRDLDRYGAPRDYQVSYARYLRCCGVGAQEEQLVRSYKEDSGVFKRFFRGRNVRWSGKLLGFSERSERRVKAKVQMSLQDGILAEPILLVFEGAALADSVPLLRDQMIRFDAEICGQGGRFWHWHSLRVLRCGQGRREAVPESDDSQTDEEGPNLNVGQERWNSDDSQEEEEEDVPNMNVGALQQAERRLMQADDEDIGTDYSSGMYSSNEEHMEDEEEAIEAAILRRESEEVEDLDTEAVVIPSSSSRPARRLGSLDEVSQLSTRELQDLIRDSGGDPECFQERAALVDAAQAVLAVLLADEVEGGGHDRATASGGASGRKRMRPGEGLGTASCDDGESQDVPCVICQDLPKTHAFIPCGHRCVCEACSKRIRGGVRSGKVCPLCRIPVTSSIRIWD